MSTFRRRATPLLLRTRYGTDRGHIRPTTAHSSPGAVTAARASPGRTAVTAPPQRPLTADVAHSPAGWSAGESDRIHRRAPVGPHGGNPHPAHHPKGAHNAINPAKYPNERPGRAKVRQPPVEPPHAPRAKGLRGRGPSGRGRPPGPRPAEALRGRPGVRTHGAPATPTAHPYEESAGTSNLDAPLECDVPMSPGCYPAPTPRQSGATTMGEPDRQSPSTPREFACHESQVSTRVE